MNFFQSSRIIDSWTNSYVTMGYRVFVATPERVVLVRGRPVNHALHFVATLLTAGLWLMVWIPLIIWGGERIVTVSINHETNAVNVHKQRMP